MFQDALRSLRECRDHVRDPLPDDGEHNARVELIALMAQMLDGYSIRQAQLHEMCRQILIECTLLNAERTDA